MLVSMPTEAISQYGFPPGTDLRHPPIRSQYCSLSLINLLRHLLERAVVGMLRLAIRLMSRESLAPQVRAALPTMAL